jgi:hypothetical protein
MTPELEEFLAADDLDDALHARGRIGALGAEDVAVVRSVLQRWEDSQAVSNLLMHPSLIPSDLLAASLFRGLAERRVAYLVLAAVVGFQSIDPAGMTAEGRRRITEALLALIRQTKGILAERASVSIQGFLGEEDAPQVFDLWAHPDDTVWHNLRAWLYRTFQARGDEAFAAAARHSKLAEEVQRQLVEAFGEWLTEPPEGFDNTLSLLFGYIPNLRDVERQA